MRFFHHTFLIFGFFGVFLGSIIIDCDDKKQQSVSIKKGIICNVAQSDSLIVKVGPQIHFSAVTESYKHLAAILKLF